MATALRCNVPCGADTALISFFGSLIHSNPCANGCTPTSLSAQTSLFWTLGQGMLERCTTRLPSQNYSTRMYNCPSAFQGRRQTESCHSECEQLCHPLVRGALPLLSRITSCVNSDSILPSRPSDGISPGICSWSHTNQALRRQ